MLFNSLTFFFFLACVYVLYRILPFRLQNWMLLVAGYVFYGFWDVRFLFLIAFSTTVDFSIGMLMADNIMTARQRWTASLFLVGAAFFSLCPNWWALRGAINSSHSAAFFTLQPLGLNVLTATIVFVLIANLMISAIKRPPKESRRKLYICCSVFVNLAFLGFFKYFNFFGSSGSRVGES